jgi:hypothetical protein
MQLPISWETFPCKKKYIDEETPELAYWYSFGVHLDGFVDIYDGEKDIFTKVPPNKADELIEARTRFVQEMLRICNDR